MPVSQLPAFYSKVVYHDRDEPIQDLQIHHGVVYAPSSHPSAALPVKVRTGNALVGGRVLAEQLAKITPLTLDILTGEMGGGQPLLDDHPLKAAAVRAVEILIHDGWLIAEHVGDGTYASLMDAALINQEKLPSFLPQKIIHDDQEYVFIGMDLLYAMAGGQFSIPAGMCFHYTVPGCDSFSPQWLTATVFHAEIPEEHKEAQMEGLRQLITDRNQIFETLITERIGVVCDSIKQTLLEDGLLLEDTDTPAKATCPTESPAP